MHMAVFMGGGGGGGSKTPNGVLGTSFPVFDEQLLVGEI